MFKVQLIIAICSLTEGVYISRMSTVNRMRVPTAFRPGFSLTRPWSQTRLVQAASNRAPYVLYRNPTQRYAFKHYGPSPTRSIFASGPWKTSARFPSMSTPEYEFVKAASTAPVVHTEGAIHTIPAPNLSLAEKPIVVIESSNKPVSEQSNPSYEVTEKYPEGEFKAAKIETPIGFSKATSFSAPDLQTLLRNGAALQLAPEYSLPAVSVNQPIVPQQFSMQAINNLPTQQDLINTGTEGIFIPPNALYQSDPMFMQKLQNQLLQRFHSIEFIPYTAEIPNQVHLQPQPSQNHQQIFLLQNEQLNQPQHVEVNEQKNVVQRETQENVVTLIPQAFVTTNNTTEKAVEVTTAQNIALELVAAESQPVATTIKYVVENKTTPIYYAQIGQSVGNVIANGFYSAINDVRAAAALAQEEKTTESKPIENTTTTTTTTAIPDLKNYFVAKEENTDNHNTTELKPLLGVPFSKSNDKVNVAYTLVRTDDKQSKVNQEGAIYAGQIIEATISEDQDFNQEKASMSKRAPIRLFAVTDTKIETPNAVPTVTVVKAKIPPKSKLTFDDKTGEPVLRIYASYVDSPAQKEALISKLSNSKQAKDSVTKRDTMDSFKTVTTRTSDKSQGFDRNQVTQFGLKLRERSDDYIPLFEEYDD